MDNDNGINDEVLVVEAQSETATDEALVVEAVQTN